jgi:hypothetical protein
MFARKTSLSGVVLIAMLMFASTWAVAQNYPPSITKLVASTKAQINTIDMAAFKSGPDASALSERSAHQRSHHGS